MWIRCAFQDIGEKNMCIRSAFPVTWGLHNNPPVPGRKNPGPGLGSYLALARTRIFSSNPNLIPRLGSRRASGSNLDYYRSQGGYYMKVLNHSSQRNQVI